jgi:carbonic anhydrase/acetyltransferase-like protein (isoleucine patch superfamily)
MSIRNYLDYSPKLAGGVYVDSSAVVIGNVKIGKDTSVWPHTTLRGDVHEISIGERTNIQDGSVLHCTAPESFGPDGFPLKVGSDVTIGHRVVLHGCTIKDRALIGMGAIIMDGAVVESDVIVGAGSVVTPGKKLESGNLYVGSPVKLVRPLRQEEIDFLLYSAAHYVKLKNYHQHHVESI